MSSKSLNLPKILSKKVAPFNERLYKNILAELFPAERACMANKDARIARANVKAGKEYQFHNKSVRTETPYDISFSSFAAVCNEALVADIKSMQERIDSGELQSETGEQIKIIDPRMFNLTADLPNCVKELLLYCTCFLKIPADCEAQIRVIYGAREKGSKIAPIQKDTVCRVIMHLCEEDEIYEICDHLTGGRVANAVKYTMLSNSYLVLDSLNFNTEKCLVVKLNPDRIFAPLIPDNFLEIAKKEASSAGYNIGKNARLDPSRMKTLEKTKKRALRYQRVTVSIDFGPSELVAKDSLIKNISAAQGGGLDFSTLTGNMKDHLKSAAGGGIGADMVDKIGKTTLGKHIQNIGSNIVNEVKGHDDLKPENQGLTEDFISTAARSAFKNINKQTVMDMAPEMDELAKEHDLSELVSDPELKREMKREFKNQNQAKTKRRNLDTESRAASSNEPDEKSEHPGEEVEEVEINLDLNPGNTSETTSVPIIPPAVEPLIDLDLNSL